MLLFVEQRGQSQCVFIPSPAREVSPFLGITGGIFFSQKELKQSEGLVWMPTWKNLNTTDFKEGGNQLVKLVNLA